MKNHIEAVIFDMGGTLRRTTRVDAQKRQGNLHRIQQLADCRIDPAKFARLLSRRARAYKKWSEETLVELTESDLWTRWMLPDQPAARIRPIAIQLNQLWREAQGMRKILPEAGEVILALFRRGYRLGLVSNTTSSVEVPRTFDKLGVSGCFETVLLSCKVGKRKPDPAILREATERMGIRPECCAYVGDRPDRDVAAARGAGFGRTILLRNRRKLDNLLSDPALAPDHVIDNLQDLLTIFPTRLREKSVEARPLYAASLSSMWGIRKFANLKDFFTATHRLGFEKVELNHMIMSSMLEGIDLSRYPISSIHEPCPAVIPAEVLRKQNWLISSHDEYCRHQGVESIRRSIDLAHDLGVRTIVVHAGQVQAENALENELRALFTADQSGSSEYAEKKERLTALRTSLVGPHLEAACKSLVELLDYAAGFDIRLGIENRYHLFDIPTLDEMEAILKIAGPDRLGFIYDVGHARTLDRLGFYPYEEWLRRYANRIIGVHLHDVIGITDHYAPGLGEVDFHQVAAYLPHDAFRTCELKAVNTPEQIKAGLKVLAESGCIMERWSPEGSHAYA